MAKLNFKEIGKRAGTRLGAAAVAAGVSIGVDLIPIDAKIRNGIKLGVGLIAPEFAPKNHFLDKTGTGLAAIAAERFGQMLLGNVKGTGVFGIGNDPEYKVEGSEYEVSGSNSNDALGNSNDALGNSEDETF